VQPKLNPLSKFLDPPLHINACLTHFKDKSQEMARWAISHRIAVAALIVSYRIEIDNATDFTSGQQVPIITLR